MMMINGHFHHSLTHTRMDARSRQLFINQMNWFQKIFKSDITRK